MGHSHREEQIQKRRTLVVTKVWALHNLERHNQFKIERTNTPSRLLPQEQASGLHMLPPDGRTRPAQKKCAVPLSG